MIPRERKMLLTIQTIYSYILGVTTAPLTRGTCATNGNYSIVIGRTEKEVIKYRENILFRFILPKAPPKFRLHSCTCRTPLIRSTVSAVHNFEIQLRKRHYRDNNSVEKGTADNVNTVSPSAC